MYIICTRSLFTAMNPYIGNTHFAQFLMSIVLSVHPGGTIGHPGGQQKKFLPFGHGRDLVAFNDTGLQNKSFQGRAEISKA